MNHSLSIRSIAMASVAGDPDANLGTLERHLRQAREQGIELAVFPEMSISGYITRPESVARFVGRQHDVLTRLLALSVQTDVAFTAGMPWREDDDCYVAQFLFDGGRLIGSHRKMYLAGSEAAVFTPGRRIDTFMVRGIRMGMQLCLESHMPELALEQSRQGAFLIAMGFASPREAPHEKLERWMRYLPARAYDNGVYVVAANQSGCSESGREFPAVALAIDPKGIALATQAVNHQVSASALIDPAHCLRIRDSRMGWFVGMR
ncbi:putative amidohydrolase [Breznakibacter xylanolyticus]|uniref:Putative amidohydrolase n=1 Tax=Breznakibacter xylanolyticus TaxID=990 RepID=A0A2W7NKJ8_9BACT|nr:nitrilase-related carbon-nitrogen hydrolase [Breznakibacter xylanolyticus]PZX20390.1 putative amidohydrolase [Breznakibacter xylanolyticus]